MNFAAEENRELVEAIVLLNNDTEADESTFRKLFSQLGIISSEYVVITRAASGDPSLYAYFARKGARREHRFPQELDESLLEKKMLEASLLRGVDLFCGVGDYVQFVNKTIVPALEGNLKPPANTADGDAKIPSETDKDSGEGEQSTHRAEKEPEVPLDAGEKGEGEPNKPTQPVDGEPELAPDGSKKRKSGPKKPKIPKFEPVLVPPEARKFCYFHKVPEIPPALLSIPEVHKFSQDEVAALRIPCKGSALWGVVTPNHPMYGVPVVCEHHARHKFFFSVWPEENACRVCFWPKTHNWTNLSSGSRWSSCY